MWSTRYFAFRTCMLHKQLIGSSSPDQRFVKKLIQATTNGVTINSSLPACQLNVTGFKLRVHITLILRQASIVDSSPVIVLTACDPRYWRRKYVHNCNKLSTSNVCQTQNECQRKRCGRKAHPRIFNFKFKLFTLFI